MKIKLAILEKDKNYMQRIVSVFGTKYADKMEIYSFTDESVAMSMLSSASIDVLIASDKFEINVKNLPKKCSFAYFVDSPNIDIVNDQRAICKFQKADLLYKQILDMYSDNVSRISELNFSDSSTKMITFASAAGGVGSSSLAAASAIHFSEAGYKTLYLNLERNSSTDVFFTAEGQFDMSDIIFALKSKKSNFILKLESCVRQDKRGVYFYSAPKIALDMLELNYEEMIQIISKLKQSGSYSYIIIDMDFSFTKDILNVYRQSHALVLVSDGSEVSNVKTVKAYNAISALEQNTDVPLTNRISLLYNKFSNKTGRVIDEFEAKVISGIPRFEHATSKQVIEQLSALDIYNNII